MDTEVGLNRVGLRRFIRLDNHTMIDVCGVGEKVFPHAKRKIQPEDCEDFYIASPQKYEYAYNILRGIEVKVSRPDFRNGFVCSGCNYHYILTPMRLIAPYEIPKGVGLIEYNKYKFSCERREDSFRIEGLKVIKKPRFRRIPQFQIDNVIAEVAKRQFKQKVEATYAEINPKSTRKQVEGI